MRTRIIAAATFLAGSVLVGVGALLIAFGVGGYGQWDRGQRVLAAALGVFTTTFMLSVLVLFARQQFFGRPRVTVSTIGLSVGSNTIPWAEIVSVGVVWIYGFRFLAVAQPASAPRRLPRIDGFPFSHVAGRRVLFVAERQLSEEFENVMGRIRAFRDPGAAPSARDDEEPWWRSH